MAEIKALSAPGQARRRVGGSSQWALASKQLASPGINYSPLGGLKGGGSLSYGPYHVGRWGQEGAPGLPGWLHAPPGITHQAPGTETAAGEPGAGAAPLAPGWAWSRSALTQWVCSHPSQPWSSFSRTSGTPESSLPSWPCCLRPLMGGGALVIFVTWQDGKGRRTTTDGEN